ncbi:hypothetical protein [uncultured Alsobacter sp.]|uniref:hypothetical protein n=1 Tax=uncultured Alsobacter sp. TaxID=1748258 RepID=UPI0025D636A5|nr:hypothetical protein [uncultured Alsobacter sp.]
MVRFNRCLMAGALALALIVPAAARAGYCWPLPNFQASLARHNVEAQPVAPTALPELTRLFNLTPPASRDTFDDAMAVEEGGGATIALLIGSEVCGTLTIMPPMWQMMRTRVLAGRS